MIAKEPALVMGVHSQFANILPQLKENAFSEPAKIRFDKALLRGACTLDPEIEGTGVCHVPGGKKSYSVRNPFHSTLNKVQVFFGKIT